MLSKMAAQSDHPTQISSEPEETALMPKNNSFGRGRMTLATTLSLAALAFPAMADEEDARAILAAMSDYLSGLPGFMFHYDSTLEVVTTEDQRIGLASSGTVTVERPGRLRATRKDGFADIELAYDGQTLTLIGHNAGLYAQIALDGTIDSMIDKLRDEHGVVLPAADLLMRDPAKVLVDGATDVKDLGVGVIGGQDCDHVALRHEDTDLQIWIAQGDAPYPCRYVLTARDVVQQPQYVIQISGWTIEESARDFSIEIPDTAREVDLHALTEFSTDLPNNFTTGADK